MYFAMHDGQGEDADKRPFPITLEEAKKHQQNGCGIFHSVNEFHGNRRIENLKRINYWYFEVDQGTKENQLKRIDKFGVVPSRVVESKRGYHIYFKAKDANAKYYTEIQRRIGYWLGGDHRAQDITRILRTPGFYHLKDPKDPFLVSMFWNYPCQYKQDVMLYAFPPIPEEESVSDVSNLTTKQRSKINVASDRFWDAVYHANQMELLKRFSGKPCVRGEVFTFKAVSGGKHNIYSNGKITSCFIDETGKIGAKSGPTIWGWLHWYGHSHKDIYRIIINEVPELCL